MADNIINNNVNNNNDNNNHIINDDNGFDYDEIPRYFRALIPHLESSDKECRSLQLNLRDFPTAEAVRHVGAVLEDRITTTNVQWLGLDRTGLAMSIPSDYISDIFTFIGLNSSLKVVKISGSFKNASSMWQAVLYNKCIRKLVLDKILGFLPPIFYESNWHHLKELELHGYTHVDNATALLAYHCVERLRLVRRARVHCNQSERIRSERRQREQSLEKFFFSMSRNSSSHRIKHLEVDGYHWEISKFLGSKTCHLVSLELGEVSFDESKMDSLIQGLADNCSIETRIQRIRFGDCYFDRETANKFIYFLKAKRCHIKELIILSGYLAKCIRGFLPIPSLSYCLLLREAFTCDCLETFEFDCDLVNRHSDDQNFDITLRRGLRNCNLQCLGLGVQNLSIPFPELTIALSMGSLKRLKLYGMRLNQETAAGLLSLANNGACHLQSLVLDDFFNELEVSDFEQFMIALGNNDELKGIGFKATRQMDSLISAVEHSLEGMKSLPRLDLHCPIHLSTSQESRLSLALLENWSLQTFTIVAHPRSYIPYTPYGRHYSHHYITSYPKPAVSMDLERAIERTMERNRCKELIFTADFDENVSISQLCDYLERYWELPSGLSLAFWALKKLPHAVNGVRKTD